METWTQNTAVSQEPVSGASKPGYAFLLSLWPFVLFVSFLGVFYILILVAAVSPTSSEGGTVLESIVIFILKAV